MPSYTTTAVAPTNGALPIVESANLSSGPYGGGGGGGGGGSIVSSFATASISSLSVSSINGAAPAGGGINPAGISTNQVSVATGTTITIGNPGGAQVAVNGAGGGFISIGTNGGSGGTGEIYLSASSTIVEAELWVSSLNGQAPGGGGGPVPANLVVSTLNVSSSILTNPTNVEITNPAGVGTEATWDYMDSSFGATDILVLKNVSTIGQGYFNPTIDAAGPVLPFIYALYESATGFQTATNLADFLVGRMFLGGDGAAPFLSTCYLATNPGGDLVVGAPSLNVNNVSTAALNVSSIQASGAVQVLSPLNVSTLVVSSINGAAPGGGSALQFSTLGIPGGPGASTFVCDPNTTSELVSFSTTAGHIYSASVFARAQVFEPAANGDTIYTEILDNSVGNEPIGNWPAQSVSTISAGGSFQYVGGAINWRAGGTGCSFSVNPSVSTNVRVDGFNLIDFGAI